VSADTSDTSASVAADTSASVAAGYEYRAAVRYLEGDQQGVVFNMWYLAYFDEAMTGYLEAAGLPYALLQAGGHDVQLVHTELDWRGALGWGDPIRIRVRPDSIGRTSFTLAFEVRGGSEDVLVTGRTVYVCIRLDGGGKTPIPDSLRAALAG
jgi:acyl-CoA thioester hydrolase